MCKESLCGDSEYYICRKDIMRFIGKVEEFQEHDIWIEYTESLDQYFLANGITDYGKKWTVLLRSCGAKTYKFMRSLVSPGKPSDKSFAELVNIVKNHLNPRPLQLTTVYYSKVQVSQFIKDRESIQQYVAEWCLSDWSIVILGIRWRIW